MNLNHRTIFNVLYLLYFVHFAQGNLDKEMTTKEIVVEIRKNCDYSRVQSKTGESYLGCDCHDLELKEIRKDLRSSIELLDMSNNRVKALTSHSFELYDDLVFLYLMENKIHKLEKGTFTPLSKLEAINLSGNVLSTIPLDLLELPKLRNLYINDNELFRLSSDLMKIPKPLKAPLHILHMSGCELSSMPDFGILPHLLELNLSRNPLDDIKPQQLSPSCSLKTIDLQNATHMSPCACQSLQIYIGKRSIRPHYGSLECEVKSYCSEIVNATVDSPQYDLCLTELEVQKAAEETKRTWYSIGAIFAIALFVVGGIYYCVRKRNVRRINEKGTKLTYLENVASK